DWGSSTVDGASASQFAALVGDVVVYTEVPGKLWDVKWNPTTSSFTTHDLLATDAGQFEGATFAPAGVGGIQSTALTTTKRADASTASPGGADGYTITISNPNRSAASLADITDTLPTGFTYTAGTSSGATASDPAISAQTLTWNGPFTVPARSGGVNGLLKLHFNVTVSSTAGTYYNRAAGASSSFTVTPTGPTAPVKVFSQFTLSVSKSGAGSIFTGWSGGGCTGTGTCTVTMSSDQAVAAAFSPSQYTLSVTVRGAGSGTVSSSPAGISCGSTCSAKFS